ncbi:hypothetical protein C5167_030392 [Papaver somniferum]|nr:hypothetical protein C5167_030392 [Papaver somniferum]
MGYHSWLVLASPVELVSKALELGLLKARHPLLDEVDVTIIRDAISNGDDVVYQRVCDDGGVISLDWSVNLDLGEGHGLDTTMLLVSGTPQGSGGKDVKLFVGKTIKRDVFRL